MNNKGFAFSTMLYGFMIVGCLLILIILGLMSTNRTNTREMVNSIEDTSARLSLASRTILSAQTGKVYYDFDVPLGYGGWYKIEVWGRDKYAAKTVNLKELTVIRIFLSSDTDYTDPTTGAVEDRSATKACSMNKLTDGSINASGYNSETEASTAYDALKIKEYLKMSDCSSGNGLIVSSGGNGSGSITQVGDGIVKSNSKYKITTYTISNSSATNYYTIDNINTSYNNKARITFVSNESSISGYNNAIPKSQVCVEGNTGVYYIKKKSSGKFYEWVDNTTFTTFNLFTGERNQKWLISCYQGACGACNVRYYYNTQNNWNCNSSEFEYYSAGF